MRGLDGKVRWLDIGDLVTRGETIVTSEDGYVQLEWFTADNVNTFRKIDGNKSKYLMPIVIDDSNPYDANVPKYFAELSIGKALQGNPDPEFLKQIKDTLQMP